MVVKRKPSRKEKRLQKKLKRLEDELSSDDEEEFQVQGKPSKAGKQDTKLSASARMLKAAATSDSDSDDEDEDEDEEDGSDGGSSSGGGEGGDGESFDELGEDEDDDDDFLGDEAAKADAATSSTVGGKDGMADVMARILNQELNKKAPVLAKRRTALMKDMDKEKRERHRAKEAAEKKRAALNHQLYAPDHKDAERERQLRRIATRGVVALFNAVTRARQAQEEGGDAGAGKIGGGKAKDMSKKDFLEMLKSSTSKTGSSSGNSASNSSSSSSSSSSSKKGERKAGGKGGKNPFFDEVPGEGGREEAEASWAAIQDDYLMTAPKINDYSEEEEEEEGMEGEGMMSESDED